MNFNKLWFPWKPVYVQLGTVRGNIRISNCYQCAKFRPCIKTFTICLKLIKVTVTGTLKGILKQSLHEKPAIWPKFILQGVAQV